MATGPFTLQPQDSQEVVYALVVGEGQNNLTSVQCAIRNVKIAHSFWALAGSGGPAFLPAPEVQVEAEHQMIRVRWDSLATDYVELGYHFEGYNVWLAEEADGPWEKVAVFDKVNAITAIWDEVLDEETGYFVSRAVQHGTDSGLSFSCEITRHPFRNTALKDWRTYHVAVTAYAFSEAPWALPRTMETARLPVAVMPHAPLTLESGLDRVTLFPNPAFASMHGVTLAGLPPVPCSIRIFTVAGQIVRVLKHDGQSPVCRWDMLNEAGRPVASGMYIVHLETETESRVLKLGVVSRAQ